MKHVDPFFFPTNIERAAQPTRALHPHASTAPHAQSARPCYGRRPVQPRCVRVRPSRFAPWRFPDAERDRARAFSLGPRGAVQRRPDGSRPTRPGDACDAKTPLANVTHSVTCTGPCEYRSDRAVRRSCARGRQDTGAGALFRSAAGAAPPIVGGERPSLGGDVLRPFRRWHRPPTDRRTPKSPRERSTSLSLDGRVPGTARPPLASPPPTLVRPPPNVFLSKRTRR